MQVNGTFGHTINLPLCFSEVAFARQLKNRFSQCCVIRFNFCFLGKSVQVFFLAGTKTHTIFFFNMRMRRLHFLVIFLHKAHTHLTENCYTTVRTLAHTNTHTRTHNYTGTFAHVCAAFFFFWEKFTRGFFFLFQTRGARNDRVWV